MIAAYERAFGDRCEPVQQAMLARKIGEALFRRGQHEQALEHFLRAFNVLGRPLPTSAWGIRLAILGQLVCQVAHRLFPRALTSRREERLDPIMEEWFRTHAMIGWIDYFTNQERFVLEALQGLNLSERTGQSVNMVLNSMSTGLICDVLPAFRVAAFYHRRGLATAERIHHPVALGHSYLGMAVHEDALGDWASALAHYQRAASAFTEAGHLRGWGASTVQIGWLHVVRGSFAAANERSQELLRVGQETSDRHILAWGLTLRGTLAQLTRSADQAVADLEHAVELSQAIPDHANAAQATALLERCHLRQGDTARALSVLDAAARIVRERGLRGMAVVQAPLAMAEAALVAVERSAGVERAHALARAKRFCRDALKQGQMMRYWLPSALRSQGTHEWLRGRPAAAAKAWRRGATVAEDMGARYELGLICLEMGRRTGDRAALARAETVLAEIEAAPDLADSRRRLSEVTGR